jgi:hypothetical protein
MPAWPFVFYCLTVKIGTLGKRPLLPDIVEKLGVEADGDH